ncbi:hypothetical protein D3C81_2024680 [compost metagenome]
MRPRGFDLFLHPSQITACTKTGAIAGQDHEAHGVIIRQMQRRRQKIIDHPTGQRIMLFRTVERQCRDAALIYRNLDGFKRLHAALS